MMRKFKNLIHLLIGLLSSHIFGLPGKKMTVIGVTGTSGKTTVVNLLYHVLNTSGKKVSMVSSINAIISGESIDTGYHVTTPSVYHLQKLMKKAADNGSRYFIIEVSSHALDQHRTYKTFIDLAIVTNISHEHLDYHKTRENYLKSKAKILSGVKYAVLNKDDVSYDQLKNLTDGKVIPFSIRKNSRYKYNKLKLTNYLRGDFNKYNILACYVACRTLGLTDLEIRRGLKSVKPIKGRMEEVKNSKGLRIIVDFAHKPNALEEVLKSVKKTQHNRLIIVFGSAGLRDTEKRQMMGEIAARYADIIVLTAEDPRTEDVRDIMDQIALGCIKNGARFVSKDKWSKDRKSRAFPVFFKIADRQEAINFVLRKIGHKGDLLLFCGKGHEKSMCYGRKEYPWDEFQAIKKALYDKSR